MHTEEKDIKFVDVEKKDIDENGYEEVKEKIKLTPQQKAEQKEVDTWYEKNIPKDVVKPEEEKTEIEILHEKEMRKITMDDMPFDHYKTKDFETMEQCPYIKRFYQFQKDHLNEDPTALQTLN